MTANVYFGHEHISADDLTTVTVDGEQFWRLMSNPPGTSPTDQCGEKELLVPADDYDLTYVGRGCTNSHAYLYVLRKKTLPQPAGQGQQEKKPKGKANPTQKQKRARILKKRVTKRGDSANNRSLSNRLSGGTAKIGFPIQRSF